MATQHTGHTQPSIDLEEHRSVGGVNTKAVSSYSWNGSTPIPEPTPFLTKPYDSVVITYTDSTKATISTVVTKLSGVTQETITLTQAPTTDTYTRS